MVPEEEGDNTTVTTSYESTPPSAAPPALRWDRTLLLVQLALLNIGSHYNQHCLSSLSTQIIQLLSTTRTQYGLLFSSQELPTIALALVSGAALVYIPYPPAAVVLTAAITLSSVLCALAVQIRSYVLLLAAKFMFGLTHGALTTLQASIIAEVFPRHVGTGFGAMLFTSRMSSYTGLILPAFLSARFGLVTAMWIAPLFTLPPLLSAISYAMLNRSHRRQQPPYLSFDAILDAISIPFLLICFMWLSIAGTVFTMLHFVPDALVTRLGLPSTTASVLSASILLAAACTSPLLGAYHDATHRHQQLLTAATASLTVGAATLAVAQVFVASPGVVLSCAAFLFLAMAFSVAPVTLMSAMPAVVPHWFLPAALGIYKSCESSALVFLHFLTGLLRDSYGTYFMSFVVLAVLAAASVVAAVALARVTRAQAEFEHIGEVKDTIAV